MPGKTKKGEKHRKGTLTDDRGSAHANLTFELEETAMSKKNKQKQQGGQTQLTDTAEKSIKFLRAAILTIDGSFLFEYYIGK